MFLQNLPIEYLSVLTAALAYFILGAIWYTPLFFGNQWKYEAEKQTPSVVLVDQPYTVSELIGSYIGEFITSIILAFFLSLFIEISQAKLIIEGIIIALFIWIGFIATTHFSAVLWGRKTIKSFFIHSSFILLGLVTMASIIVFMKS